MGVVFLVSLVLSVVVTSAVIAVFGLDTKEFDHLALWATLLLQVPLWASLLGVAVWAFTRPGLSSDNQPDSVRVHDGAWFAVVFVLGAIAVAALAYLGSLSEERRALTDAR